MQNNKRPGFKGWMRDKGYYIVLVLCIAAVGISGYLYFTQSATPTGDAAPTVSMAQDQETAATSDDSSSNTTAGDSSQQSESTDDAAETDAPLQLQLPVQGAVEQVFATDHLAYNATTQDWRVHNGVDLTAQEGTSVCAAAAGTVSAVMEDDFMGFTVEISHDGGYTTRYCNLASDVPVQVGDQVQAGAVIGTVGSTAKLELEQAPHLHFEVCRGEELLNPEAYFVP